MRGFLLDTNVLSEVRKGPARADAVVWQWWQGMQERELFLSVMTLGEIRNGIDRLAVRDKPQSLILERWLAGLKNSFNERVLEVTRDVADCWGRLQTIRSLPVVDALIAATALHHDLTLVTRNVSDFKGLGLTMLNPFQRSM
jgi:predicted nucleic acid-binding protein